MDTLDSLSDKIQEISDDPIVQKLAKELILWKDNSDNVTQLESTIERFIGTSWIQSDKVHDQVYQLWSTFRDENIKVIGGMTMNERLYSFGLMKRYDKNRIGADKDVIYKKLLAKR